MSLPFGPNQDQYIVVRVDNGKGQCIQHAVQWNPQGGQVVAYPTLKVSTSLEFCSGVGGGHEVGAEKYGRGGDAPGFSSASNAMILCLQFLTLPSCLSCSLMELHGPGPV